MQRIFFLINLVFLFFSMSAQQTRIINFAGMEWVVRSGKGNPANNLWSDSTKSVWVDQQNRLHLKIRKINGKWYAAEVFSLRPTHYGKHIFYVANRVDLLDKNLVAAVFIYKDDLHETDIEFSRWKIENNKNSQYVVQPESKENMKRFDLKLSGDFSTHIINWQPEKISFQSYYGHYPDLPNDNFLINRWFFSQKKLINDDTYKIHINLWMADNQPPSDLKEAELIIASMDSPISAIQIEGETYPEISFYPNHYYDHIFVYYSGQFEKIQYEITDKNGKVLISKNPKTNYFFIDLVKVPIGTYKLKLVTKNKIYFYKIIKNY